MCSIFSTCRRFCLFWIWQSPALPSPSTIIIMHSCPAGSNYLTFFSWAFPVHAQTLWYLIVPLLPPPPHLLPSSFPSSSWSVSSISCGRKTPAWWVGRRRNWWWSRHRSFVSEPRRPPLSTLRTFANCKPLTTYSYVAKKHSTVSFVAKKHTVKTVSPLYVD